MQTTPSLEVASATFLRPECGHAQLFHPEYKRSNRTKGLKILRCFPHCCPEHIDRSYCGASLSVRVELLKSQSLKEEPKNSSSGSELLAVFARFEALGDVTLKPDDCVEVHKMEDGTQTETNPDAQWVRGVLDRPSKLVMAIRTPETPLEEQKPLFFHLNSKANARWYYDWESGANKAQRLMKHALKAYLVQRCAVDGEGNFVAPSAPKAQTQLYRVVHVIASPEFTVISYRRAPSEHYQSALPSPRDTPRHGFLVPEYAGAYLESDSIMESARSLSHLSDTKRASFPTSMDGRYAPVYDAGHRVKRQRASTRPLRSVGNSGLLQDKLRWEHANSSTVAISRNLALLYSFLRWTPLNVYASFVDELVHLLHHNLKELLSGFSNRISRLNCFSKLIFNQVEADQATVVASSFIHGSRIPSRSPSTLTPEMGRLLYALTQATLWLFSTRTRQWIRSFIMKHAESVLNKYALRASFVMFVQKFEDRLNQQVFKRTELRSVDNVAEEIISAVYSHEYFHARRSYVREILSGQNFAGWHAFVAQMRQTYINSSECPGVPRAFVRRQPTLSFGEAHPPRNSVENAWNAEWILDVDEAVWKFSEAVTKDIGEGRVGHVGDDDGSVSLFSLLEVISFMVRLEVAIDVQARTLHARSTLGVAGPLDCLRVVMDGKERVFSTFPNGMTSSLDVGTHGDYIAEVQVEHSERLVVYLQLFKWSVREDGSSYHVRMRIECWRSRRLCISGDVMVTTAPASFASEEVAYAGEMSLQNKRAAVDRSFAQQARRNPTAKWVVADAAPWRELGRFRLSYIKA